MCPGCYQPYGVKKEKEENKKGKLPFNLVA